MFRERRPSPPPLKLTFGVLHEQQAADIGDVHLQRDRNNRIRLRLGDSVTTTKRGPMRIVSVYWETNNRGHVLLRPV